ncbi:hypothetical protein [Candidatus Leptofilum sp.]|uniref:hypothetical protein n=1 Tax=Candidatus Leptofilum sp. TaxID=3241576 RepID=UPI003B5A7946
MPNQAKLTLLLLALTLLTLAIPHPSQTFASECGVTSVGFVPLNDLGAGTHLGSQGGLYPNGSNELPAAHAEAGLAIANSIQPLNSSGQVDVGNGRIVLLSIGMSNTSQEFQAFMSLAENDPLRAANVAIVNGAQGGKTAENISNPTDDFWPNVDQRLAMDGLTPQQVQIIWMKQVRSNVDPSEQFPTDAQILRDQLQAIVQIAKDRFPNLKIIYLSSRIYAGYASTDLSPEPEAYQSGFGVKWLIEEQINGNPDLNYDPMLGTVNAPWLAWGPYLWADGLTPRSDGLTWLCSDFVDDGTHPSDSGAAKVAGMLQEFFRSEATAVPWYIDLSQLSNKQFLPLVLK